jgi:ferritin-like metal-binding protein YciE
MPALTNPKQLFLHGLKDIYYVEKALVRTLPSLADEATDRELKQGLTKHLGQTKQQVAKLERVFAAIGEQPAAEQCPGFDGIKREHDEFMRDEDPSREMRDVFLTGAAARTEHYEIAAYTELLALARALGERECVQLLDANLKQEKEALKLAESAGRRIARESARANGRRGSTTRRSSSRSRSSTARSRSSASRSTTRRRSAGR